MSEQKCLVCGVPFTKKESGEWVDQQGKEITFCIEGEPLACQPCWDKREDWYKCPCCELYFHENYQSYTLLDGQKYCDPCAEWEDDYTVINDTFKCRKCGHTEKWQGADDECPEECPKC